MTIPDAPLGASHAGSEESLALAENLARGASDPEQTREAARIFALEGRRDRAIDVLRQGTLTQPRHSGLNAALAEFRRAVDLDPESSESHFNLGWALLAEDELIQAETTLMESVRLDPGNVEGLYALALLHQRTGAYARAAAELKQAIEKRPDEARLHYYLGVAYNSMDAADQAILALETAARLKPDDPRIHRLLGVAFDKKEMPARAREA